MLNFSPAKFLVVGIVAMILLGPDKLPQFARQVGSAWRSFKRFQTRVEEEVRSSIPDLPNTKDLARMARSPVALLNQLAEMPAEDAVPDPAASLPDAITDDTPWPADTAAPDPDSDPGTGASVAPAAALRRAGRPAGPSAEAWTGHDGVSPPDDPSMN